MEGDRGPGMISIGRLRLGGEYYRLAEIDRCFRVSPVFCWRLTLPSDWLHFGYIIIASKPEWVIESR